MRKILTLEQIRRRRAELLPEQERIIAAMNQVVICAFNPCGESSLF